MNHDLTEYILKKSKKKDKNLMYDFMPSLLEVIERPSHVAGTIVIISVALLLLTAIIWASLAKLDVVVTGVGTVTPEGWSKEVKSDSDGVVRKICVKNGDYVKKGEDLVLLDSSVADADIEALEYQIQWLKIQHDIYSKILSDPNAVVKESDYDPKFSNGVKYLIDEMIYNERQKNQYPSEESSYGLQREMQQYKQLSDIEMELQRCENERIRYQKQQRSMRIQAPVNGTVHLLSVNHAGQLVSSAQSIATIVPKEEPLMFQCFIKDRDIANVSVGKEVVLKVSAYSYSDYGAVTGTVSRISPSAIADEKLGNVYMVDIAIQKTNKKIELMSGLSGSVEIIVGKRSVMDYFMEPITRGLQDSMKEE